VPVESPRIVIVGGGFGGVKCAKTLRKSLPDSCEIILFNSENHMVFHPLLAEVAGGAIQPKDVAAPLRQMLNGVQCRTEEVLALELSANCLEYEAHDGRRQRMRYDHLVIACGNTVNLGLVPGMDEHAFGLKTVGDALALQAHVMQMMEKAEVCDDPARKRWYLSFVIVGAGFSGVEVAGEINDLLKRSLKFFPNIKKDDFQVTIVHAGDEILPQIGPSLRQFARKRMEHEGVKFLLNTLASAATGNGIAFKDGTFLPGGTVVCTIGNTTLPIIQRLDLPKHQGRVITEPDMSLPGFPNAWAIGDAAAIKNAVDDAYCPSVAQFAERQGTQCAKNIVARINKQETKPFSFKMIGQLCAIGGHNAVGEFFDWKISGFLAWFMWRGVYLSKLPSHTQQIRVGIEWALDLVFPRTLAHLKADLSRRVCRAYYAEGDYVFRQGDPATDFYVIESGEVEVLRQYPDGESEVIAVLGAGDFFGEAALIDCRTRNAAVRARSELEVTVLGRSVFTQISAALGPLRDAMATAMKRRTNIWNNLHDVRDVLDTVPLKQMLEPLPDRPITCDCRIADLLDRLNKNRLDFCIVVDDDQRLIGIVTRSDLFRAVEVAAAAPEGGQINVTVKDIMVKDPITISLTETTTLALMTMREHGLKTLPVLEDTHTGVVKGYVRLENIMDCVIKQVLVNGGVVKKKPTQQLTMQIQKVRK
jgi:NADH:ubiquinone reductase (H+-translocating)